MSNFDDNFIPIASAAADDAGLAPTKLLVDPATGRLLITIAIVGTSTSVLNAAEVDENGIWPAMAVTDDASEDVKPFQVDNRNGFLYCDINVE